MDLVPNIANGNLKQEDLLLMIVMLHLHLQLCDALVTRDTRVTVVTHHTERDNVTE